MGVIKGEREKVEKKGKSDGSRREGEVTVMGERSEVIGEKYGEGKKVWESGKSE